MWRFSRLSSIRSRQTLAGQLRDKGFSVVVTWKGHALSSFRLTAWIRDLYRTTNSVTLSIRVRSTPPSS